MRHGTVEHNPDRYAELSKPFGSDEAATAAVLAFYQDVQELRVKHHLRDVLVVVAMNTPEGVAMTTLNFGDSTAQLSLAAFAYGQENARHSAQIAALLAGKTVK